MTVNSNQDATASTGTPLAPATAIASDTRPGGGVSPTTSMGVPVVPGAFAIQQTITVTANVTTGIQSGSTFGGSASSTVFTSAAPVPAPAGLVLALVGLPILGYRRIFRKNAAK